MELPMKKPLLSFLFLLAALTCLAQGVPALEQLKADPKKAYGNEHFRIIEGEHSLTDAMMKRDLLPLIKQLLEL